MQTLIPDSDFANLRSPIDGNCQDLALADVDHQVTLWHVTSHQSLTLLWKSPIRFAALPLALDPNSNQPLHVTTAWPNDQNIFPLVGAAAYSNLCNPLYKKIVFKRIECRGIVCQTAILKFVSWFCRGWPLWIQMGHVGGRRAFAKSSAAHQPP